jgi:hypothetical protein
MIKRYIQYIKESLKIEKLSQINGLDDLLDSYILIPGNTYDIIKILEKFLIFLENYKDFTIIAIDNPDESGHPADGTIFKKKDLIKKIKKTINLIDDDDINSKKTKSNSRNMFLNFYECSLEWAGDSSKEAKIEHIYYNPHVKFKGNLYLINNELVLDKSNIIINGNKYNIGNYVLLPDDELERMTFRGEEYNKEMTLNEIVGVYNEDNTTMYQIKIHRLESKIKSYTEYSKYKYRFLWVKKNNIVRKLTTEEIEKYKLLLNVNKYNI